MSRSSPLYARPLRRWLSRRLLVALALAGLLLVSLSLPASAVNEEQILVSNLTIGNDATGTGFDVAQPFTTGSHPGGYTVKKVALEFNVTGATPTIDTHTVSLWSTTASGDLDTKLVDFTNPATVTNGFNSYTLATAHNLDTDTTYAVFFDRTGASNDMKSVTVSDDGEQKASTVGAPGWSIANESIWRGHSSTGAWNTSHDSLRIAVFGAARDPAVPATLVSTIDQTHSPTDPDNLVLSSFDHAQAFTTGGDTAGYVLTKLQIGMNAVGTNANAPTYTVNICSTDGSGHPTSTCHGELAGPSSLAVGHNTFTPKSGGIVLNHNTTYAVVWDTTNGGTGFKVNGVSTSDEDVGAVAGWSIANSGLKRTQTTGTTWNSVGMATMHIALTGRLKVATAAERLSAEIDGSTMILGYARGLNTAAPVPGRFGRTVGSTAGNATAASVDGRLLKLTVPTVNSGDTVTFFYTVPTTGNKLKDIDGNEIARVSHEAVTNLTGVTPSISTATIDGDTLVLTFDRALDANVIVPVTNLGIAVDGGAAQAATKVSISSKQVTATVPAVTAGQTVKVRYTRHPVSAANRLKDLFGNEFATFTNQDVTNNTRAVGVSAAPTGLTAQGGVGQVVLNWTDPSDSTITGYQTRQSTDGGSTWSAWTDISGSDDTTVTHTVSSLTNGTKYTFELRAVVGTTNGEAASVSATPAAALVHNLGMPAKNSNNVIANDAAQAFTTGSHEAGYRLLRVILGMHVDGTGVAPTNYSVSIQGNNSSNQPDGTEIGDLIEPAALTNGGNTIEAAGDGIHLSSGTTYWIVFDSVSGGTATVAMRDTGNDGETQSQTGWGIGDNRLTRGRVTTTWGTNNDPHKIGVYGYAKTGPPAPTNPQAAASDGQVTLSWANPSNTAISKYQYRQSTDGGTNWSAWTDVPSSGAGTTSHTVGSLTNGTAYTFQVRAVIDQGNTPGTASANVTATPRQQPPAAPSGLSAQAGDTQVRLTWTNPGDSLITKYQYRVSADGGTNWNPNWTDVSGSGAGTTSYTVTGLTNGTTYRIELRAVRGASNAGPAASVTAVAGVPPPAVPTGLRATAGDTQASLRWTNPGNSAISKYQYRVSADGGSSWSPNWTDISGSGATTTSYTVTGLTNGTTYRIELRAVRGTSNAGPSAATSATPGQPPPATPMGLTVTAGQGGITLRWSNPGDSSITRYEYSLDGSTWIAIPNSGPGTTSYTIAGVTTGTVRLRAVNASGAGSGFLATSRPVVAGERLVLVAVYDTVGWRRFHARFGENCWDEMEAAIAAASRTSSGRTPEGDELALCQRFLAEDIRDVEYVWRVVR